MVASGAPEPDRPQRFMSVELVSIPDPPAPKAGVTPPPRARPEASPDRKTPTIAPSGPATPAPTPTPDAGKDDGDTFYIGPPAPGLANVPPGLAGLMADDPCAARFGLKPKECAGRDLAKRTGPMDSNMPASPEQLAQFYGEFMPKCPYWSGCDGSHLLNTNGTRSVAKPGPGSANDRGQSAPMAGGAASLGGLNATTGRLPVNPDFRDRGFGD